jgi:hypothetical protein
MIKDQTTHLTPFFNMMMMMMMMMCHGLEDLPLVKIYSRHLQHKFINLTDQKQ